MFFFTTPAAITAEKKQDVNQVSRKQLGSKTLTKAIARTCGQVSRLASLTRLETKDYPMISHVRPTRNKSKQDVSPALGVPADQNREFTMIDVVIQLLFLLLRKAPRKK